MRVRVVLAVVLAAGVALVALILLGVFDDGSDTKVVYDDPWSYCDAVGTIDQPDERYAGPPNPPEMRRAFAVAIGEDPDAPPWSGETGPALTWRCADGELRVCTYGANIPCDSKANEDEEPTAEMQEWCAAPPPEAAQPGTDEIFIPAFVTGRETIYEWHCRDGKPVIAGQVFEVDAQGYIADFWYHVLPVN